MASDNTSYRLLDWAAMVRDMWGADYYKPDVVYNFSNGREFKSTDAEDSGIYE